MCVCNTYVHTYISRMCVHNTYIHTSVECVYVIHTTYMYMYIHIHVCMYIHVHSIRRMCKYVCIHQWNVFSVCMHACRVKYMHQNNVHVMISLPGLPQTHTRLTGHTNELKVSRKINWMSWHSFGYWWVCLHTHRHLSVSKEAAQLSDVWLVGHCSTLRVERLSMDTFQLTHLSNKE